MNDDPADSHAETFERALAEYLQAVEDGASFSEAAWLARYPQHAEALREFLHNHQRAEALLRPAPYDLLATDSVPRRSGVLDSGFQLTDETRHFGPFELLEEIDRGGMGVVFKALERRLDRIVALKMIKSGELATREEIQRFQTEAQAAGALHHPHIVTVHGAGEIDGLQYISMAFIEGETLGKRLERGPLDPREAAVMVRKLALAVQYAHDRGVVHRDLKPSNVLIDAQGEPAITDFGLAKVLSHDTALTTTGQILGTPGYMAPEQARQEESEITPSVDIYALGAILYAACTGYAPHTAKTPIDVILKVLEADPVPPWTHRRAVPRSLGMLCLKCLEKRARDRYASARSVADDLDRFLRDEPLLESQVSLLNRFRRWLRREPALAAHWVGIAVISLVSTIFFLQDPSDPPYYFKHLAIQAGWALLCFPLEKLTHRPALERPIQALWGSLDVVIFTIILWNALPPRAGLLVGYPVMVVASGLFGRSRFVILLTIQCILGYLVLAWRFPEDLAPRPAHFVFFPAGLLVLALIARAQVRRLQALSEYFRDR